MALIRRFEAYWHSPLMGTPITSVCESFSQAQKEILDVCDNIQNRWQSGRLSDAEKNELLYSIKITCKTYNNETQLKRNKTNMEFPVWSIAFQGLEGIDAVARQFSENLS